MPRTVFFSTVSGETVVRRFCRPLCLPFRAKPSWGETEAAGNEGSSEGGGY